MKYIALFRGINVGGNKKVEMKKLKSFFESLDFKNVSTYINSGNVTFETSRKPQCEKIESALEKEFGFAMQVLIKTEKEIQEIAAAIPGNWQNDAIQRTDVAYLFPDIDSRKTLDELPVKKEFIEIRYTKGAIFWNIQRKNVYKSQLAKIISHKLYKSMTVRNVNTARYLVSGKK